MWLIGIQTIAFNWDGMTVQKKEQIPWIWVLKEVYQVFGGQGTGICLKTVYVMLLLKLF